MALLSDNGGDCTHRKVEAATPDVLNEDRQTNAKWWTCSEERGSTSQWKPNDQELICRNRNVRLDGPTVRHNNRIVTLDSFARTLISSLPVREAKREKEIRDLLSIDYDLASLVELLRLLTFAFRFCVCVPVKAVIFHTSSYSLTRHRTEPFAVAHVVLMLLSWQSNAAPILYAEVP